MSDRELPPLPNSDYGLCFYDEGGMQEAPGEGYTEAQMRAYAEAAIKLEREAIAQFADLRGEYKLATQIRSRTANQKEST